VKLDDALQGVARLGIDTAPIIYLIESNARYDALVLDVVQRIADGRITGITSVITLSEVLVLPLSRSDRGFNGAIEMCCCTAWGFGPVRLTPRPRSEAPSFAHSMGCACQMRSRSRSHCARDARHF
jgi:hypothetical protein